MQIKSNRESNDHISDSQNDETGFKEDADLLLDQVSAVPDVILSKCSQKDTLSGGKSKCSVSNIIYSKKETDHPRDVNGHKLSP